MTSQPTQIELSKGAYEVIATGTAKRLPHEAGGILLGYREDQVIVVTHSLVVDSPGASATRYIRDDVRANDLLSEFLAVRASDDPIGYIGEWHSHPAPSGPSSIDVAAIRATAKTCDRPIVLIVHSPSRLDPFFGLIARRRRFGRVTTKEAHVTLPQPRFPPLGPLPDGAVRGDGPVFISYRQSDGTSQAESLEDLLRAAGLVVWRDRTDLRPGTTTDRLEQALTEGLSAAVLVVTPEMVHSEIVRERELPRLLQLDDDSAFSLCIANGVARPDNKVECDYAAPDRLLRLAPARTLADKKQSNLLEASGQIEIVRDLLMHRIEQRKFSILSERRPVTIRIQSRPVPFAIDAGDEDLHIRIKSASNDRLPARDGLKLVQRTLPLSSDAVYAAGARIVRITGGAHLSIALALGASLPETKFGTVEILDTRGNVWTSTAADDDPMTNQLHTGTVRLDRAETKRTPERVAILVSMTPDPDRTAFERLLHESAEGFAAAAEMTIHGSDRIDPREAGRLSAAVAQQIKHLSAGSGRAEVHLAFHGPFAMAVLVGRHLNTLRTVVYEWDGEISRGASYVPLLVLDPGITGGPLVKILT